MPWPSRAARLRLPSRPMLSIPIINTEMIRLPRQVIDPKVLRLPNRSCPASSLLLCSPCTHRSILGYPHTTSPNIAPLRASTRAARARRHGRGAVLPDITGRRRGHALRKKRRRGATAAGIWNAAPPAELPQLPASGKDGKQLLPGQVGAVQVEGAEPGQRACHRRHVLGLHGPRGLEPREAGAVPR